MYIYPWDIIDEGIEPCLETLKSLGLDELSVAINYHTAKILLPHNPKRHLFFTEPGALYFDPRPDRYPKGLEPYEGKLTAGSTFLADLIEKASRFDLDVIAWTVCMHNTRLGFMRPEMTVENAPGGRLLHNLCPSNPLSRGYVLGIVGEVADRFAPKAIELETPSFLGFTHGYHHEIAAIDIPPSLDFLLSLCFCRYCREKADESGIETGILRERVADHIRREFEAPFLPHSPREVMALIPGLEEYIDCRAEIVTSFVELVKKEGCPETELIAISTVFPPNADSRLLYGADPFELERVSDRVTVSGYFDEAARLAEDIDLLTAGGMDTATMRVGLRPQLPDARSYNGFAAKLRVVAERSVGGVSFYNYGTMRASSLAWIRDGLREVRG